MDNSLLESILAKLPSAKIGVLGDGCVDIYWEADMRLSELSREVPHYPLPIVRERFSLGAGSNVVANLKALGVGNLRYTGLAGKDWRGVIFTELLEAWGVDCADLVIGESCVTPAYCKPIRQGISEVRYEDPRLDFANLAPVSPETEDALLKKLEELAGACDLLVICDQLNNGCITQRVLERIRTLGKTKTIITDSRNRVGQFTNTLVKPNEVEAARALGLESADPPEEAARSLSAKTGKPVLITLGEEGALWCEDNTCTRVPAFPTEPPIDFVGAGDSFLAGFAAALSVGCAPTDAVAFGNLTSSVTIKKIGTTGTASPAEMTQALAERSKNHDF